MKPLRYFRFCFNQGAVLISVLVFMLVSFVSIEHLTRVYLSLSSRYFLYNKTQEWQFVVDSELNRQVQIIMIRANEYWQQLNIYPMLKLDALHRMTDGLLKVTVNKLNDDCVSENQVENLEVLCLSMNVTIKSRENPIKSYPSSNIEFALFKAQ